MDECVSGGSEVPVTGHGEKVDEEKIDHYQLKGENYAGRPKDARRDDSVSQRVSERGFDVRSANNIVFYQVWCAHDSESHCPVMVAIMILSQASLQNKRQ